MEVLEIFIRIKKKEKRIEVLNTIVNKLSFVEWQMFWLGLINQAYKSSKSLKV